ncbi:MAG TPA: hypothetical protein VFB62_09040 [Polyangiaceae bacterium]|jgi:Spy/CpxP family protein refolding chaperone|nr:hypothetical protein [Polyangiaceae bacterium]
MKKAIGYALVLVMSAACAGTSSTDEGPIEERSQPLEEGAKEQAPPPPHAKRGGPHGGPAMLLHVALRELELSKEQRTEIEGQLKALEVRPKVDRDDKREALADAVRSGSVDASKFEDDAPMKEHHARMTAALEKLHATLTPEQRSALVAIVRDREADRPPRRAPEGRRKMEHNPTAGLLRGIEVSDEQRTRIDAALDRAGLSKDDGPAKHFEEMQAKQKALLDAFVGQSFDADALMTAPPKPKFVEALAVIVPLLDEGQRAQLAERIEQGPPHGKRAKHGRGARL